GQVVTKPIAHSIAHSLRQGASCYGASFQTGSNSTTMSARSSPFAVGTMLAVLAAISFGITAPIIERAGHGLGPLTTAALLYLGAGWATIRVLPCTSSSGTWNRSHLPRLLLVALFGAAVAPTLLAFGLQRTGATTGSLLLNLEAVFTVVLARAFLREPIGRRIATALALMVVGGCLLTLDSAR